jgi:hypothetical protein
MNSLRGQFNKNGGTPEDARHEDANMTNVARLNATRNVGGFVVEKGIPVPDVIRGHANRKYPFYVMEVGDSVLISGKTKNAVGSLTNAAHKRTGFEFTYRSVDGGVRVWRTA